MDIHFHRIDRLYSTHKADIDKIIASVYSSGQVLQGKAVKELEEKTAVMCNRLYAVALGSCTDALSLSLAALGIRNQPVYVNRMTFEADHTVCAKAECPMRFIGYNHATFNPDKNCIHRLDAGPKAMIFVNLFGQMADMDHLEYYCNKRNIILIEDAAQSFTSSWLCKPAGSFGKVSCISYDPTKICPAFATGGMALTNDKALANEIRRISYKNWGTNCQMSTLQASLILYWYKHLGEWEARRKEIASKYRVGLAGLKEVICPETAKDSNHVFHKFVIKAQRRDALQIFLSHKNIGTKIHYPVDKEVLSLPMYPYLHNEEIEKIIKEVREFYKCT